MIAYESLSRSLMKRASRSRKVDGVGYLLHLENMLVGVSRRRNLDANDREGSENLPIVYRLQGPTLSPHTF